MTRMQRFAVGASSAALAAYTLAACSLAPRYERPAAPIPQQYPAEDSAESAPSSAAHALGWSEFFGDPHLRDLLALAVQNNRNLRMAMQRVAEARAMYGIQRADQLPTIGAGAIGSRSRVPADLSITGQPLISSQYQATLDLSLWEIDFWGRVRNLKSAALESYLATEQARRAVTISLVAQVANSYLFGCEIDERLAIAQKALASREQSARFMRRRHEVGSASKLDATQSEMLLNQAQAELTALERERELNHHALDLLAGAALPADSRPLSAIESTFAHDIAPGLPSELLENRPDILAAEHRLKAAHANIGAARAAFFPRIALTGSFGSASSALDGLFGAGGRAWNYTPAISVPIFSGGRNKAGLDLAEARRNIAVSLYEQTVQNAFREVADALANRHWLARLVAVQRTSVAIQTERTRLADLRYRSGAASYLEVLDAERDRFAAEQALVQTRRAWLASAVDLYAALGGGTVPSEP